MAKEGWPGASKREPRGLGRATPPEPAQTTAASSQSSKDARKTRRISIAAIVVSGLAAAGSIWATYTVAQFTTQISAVVTAKNDIWYCTQYQGVVIDRIHDGLTDQAIVDLAPIFHDKSMVVHTPGVVIPEAVQLSVAASVADQRSFQSVMAGQDTGQLIGYSPCGFETEGELLAYVAAIRASLDQVPQPTH